MPKQGERHTHAKKKHSHLCHADAVAVRHNDALPGILGFVRDARVGVRDRRVGVFARGKVPREQVDAAVKDWVVGDQNLLCVLAYPAAIL